MNTYDNFFYVDVLELKTLLEKEKMLFPKQQGRTQHMLQVTELLTLVVTITLGLKSCLC